MRLQFTVILGLLIATQAFTKDMWRAQDHAKIKESALSVSIYKADKYGQTLKSPNRLEDPNRDSMIVRINLQEDTRYTIDAYSELITMIKQNGISPAEEENLENLFTTYAENLRDLVDSFNDLTFVNGPLEYETIQLHMAFTDPNASALEKTTSLIKHSLRGFVLAAPAIIGSIILLPSGIDNIFFENHKANKEALDANISELVKKYRPEYREQ